MVRGLKGALSLAKATMHAWNSDNAPKMAAALAYYTAFALAPLLLIAISVAGVLFGREAARGEMLHQITGLLGTEIAEAVQGILARTWKSTRSLPATLLGIAALVLAGSGVSGELQDSLNVIWKVKKKSGRGILGTLKDRFLSFSLVVGIGFLLLVTLVVSAGLQAIADASRNWTGTGTIVGILNPVISFGIITLLFATMFKILPDARTRWRDIWVGAALTALLFSAGKFAIGFYLGNVAVGSAYGAAGSFVVLLLWINYSSQILFLGAEFTKLYADAHGVAPRPHADAVAVAAS